MIDTDEEFELQELKKRKPKPETADTLWVQYKALPDTEKYVKYPEMELDWGIPENVQFSLVLKRQKAKAELLCCNPACMLPLNPEFKNEFFVTDGSRYCSRRCRNWNEKKAEYTPPIKVFVRKLGSKTPFQESLPTEEGPIEFKFPRSSTPTLAEFTEFAVEEVPDSPPTTPISMPPPECEMTVDEKHQETVLKLLILEKYCKSTKSKLEQAELKIEKANSKIQKQKIKIKKLKEILKKSWSCLSKKQNQLRMCSKLGQRYWGY